MHWGSIKLVQAAQMVLERDSESAVGLERGWKDWGGVGGLGRGWACIGVN